MLLAPAEFEPSLTHHRLVSLGEGQDLVVNVRRNRSLLNLRVRDEVLTSDKVTVNDSRNQLHVCCQISHLVVGGIRTSVPTSQEGEGVSRDSQCHTAKVRPMVKNGKRTLRFYFNRYRFTRYMAHIYTGCCI